MIHWAWLIPVFIIGAVVGMVLTCLAVEAGKEGYDQNE